MSDIRYRRKMKLLETIQTASELTARLNAQLESSDQETWEDILGRRAEAMDRLEAVHGNASERERESCRGELKQLHRDDELLREKSDYILGMLALEIREQLGRSSYKGHTAGGDTLLACLDRKA